MSDLEFMVKMVDAGAIERLRQVVANPFKRLAYTDAITLLQEHVAAGKKFEYPARGGA